MTNRVFLLGAGFSKLAGLPLANELVNFLQNHLNTSCNTSDIDFRKEFSDFIIGINPSLSSNVELFLTYIDLALLNNSVGIFTHYASPEDLRLFRMRLSGTLFRAFKYAHYAHKENITEQKEINKIFLKFCENLNEGDTVITFNYDLIVEKGLWLKDKWTFLDGYGLYKNINDFQATWGGTYPSDKPTESIVKVYKLHGSLGWIYDGLDEQIIFIGMPDYFPGYAGLFCERNLHPSGARWDEGTTFIEPSYLKRFNSTPVLGIWERAFQALQQANELIIIGYSLPEADVAAQVFLASAVRTSKIQSITVIDPCGSVFDKFSALFGKEIVKKEMPFEKWVKNEL